MSMKRLALKRPQAGPAAGGEGGNKRAPWPTATQPAPLSQPEAVQGGGADRGWAADFAAEVGHGAAVQQPAPAAPAAPAARARLAAAATSRGAGDSEDSMDADSMDDSPPPSLDGNDEERQGLLKVVLAAQLQQLPEMDGSDGWIDAAVVESMRRRVDEGHLQLERMRRLRHQKQQLVAAGEQVVAQHCGATWKLPLQWQQHQRLAGSHAVRVHSLQAHCAAGQWWVRAVVSLPDEQHRQQQEQQQPWGSTGGNIRSSIRLSLLAASPTCSLVCRQQQCRMVSSSSSSSSAAMPGGELLPACQLELTALLDVQQQDKQQQQQQGSHMQQQDAVSDAWVDVFLRLEQPQEVAVADGGCGLTASAAAVAVATLQALPAPPPIPLGRVQLSWQQWLKSHGGGGEGSDVQLPPPLPPPQQHSRVLAVSSQELDLACLHQLVQQQLGCVPAAAAPTTQATAAASTTPVGQWTCYALLPAAAQQQGARISRPVGGAAAAAAAAAVAAQAPAAQVCISQHGSHFVEVELQASSTHLLDVLQQQLVRGLQKAAQATGAPPGDVAVTASLLAAQHAQHTEEAAGSLVLELDASIDWVEALLKERLASGSQQWRHKAAAPGAHAIQQRQAAALAAMAATDGLLVSLLSC